MTNRECDFWENIAIMALAAIVMIGMLILMGGAK